MNTAKATKHTGEKEAGINLQMRLVPLKKGDDKKAKPETETISVAIDDRDRPEGANELKLKVPVMNSLHGQGVQFLDNLLALRSEIFEPKGWVDYKSMCKRFECIAKFLKGLGSQALNRAMKDSREEFLTYCGVDLNTQESRILLMQEQAFERWLGSPPALVAGKWLARDQQLNFDALDKGRYRAFLGYERSVQWNIGKMLWNDHGEAYENHHDYFLCKIVKPYSMDVQEYHYAMKMYAEKLKLMQPPSYKKASSYEEADWALQETQVDDRFIRRAIYNGLPKPYQKNLSIAYEFDWRQMEEETFLQAIASFEAEDKAKQEERKMESDRSKNNKKRDRGSQDRNHGGKRDKRYDSRDKLYCKYCKKAGSKYFQNHNSNDCTMRKKWEEQGKLSTSKKAELNTMEQLAATAKEQQKTLEKLLKKVASSDAEDESD